MGTFSGEAPIGLKVWEGLKPDLRLLRCVRFPERGVVKGVRPLLERCSR